MSETKFTKGPWYVPTGPFISGLSVETRTEGVDIECPGSGGSMSLTQTVCKLEWSGTPEWEANAHLIAAAPDMYGTLDMMSVELDLLRQAIEAGDPKAELLIRVEDMQKRNRKVRAKAHPKEPK